MDIVEACKASIEMQLKELEQSGEVDFRDEFQPSQQQQTQSVEAFVDRDKNINKILNQQAHLKRMIDEDNHIQLLKSSVLRVSHEIDEHRKQCTKLNGDAIRNRQELAEAQAKELERYQMGQLRSIAEDYSRHQEILEQRKKEIQSLKKEIEREAKNRDAYLVDVEKKLDKQLQDRQKALRGGALPFQSSFDNTGDFSGQADGSRLRHEGGDIQLISVDEYAPYGTAPHSRMPSRSTSGRGGAARGRARRRRGQ